MKCPKCITDLVVTSQERLKTTSEHVSNPNATPSLKNLWQCTNSKCQCFRAFGWNDDGDFYSLDYHHKTSEVFPDDNYSAIGSIARKLDVEVYGKGLPEKKYFSPIWMLFFFQPFIEWHGLADEDDNILEKWWTLGILKKDSGFRNRYCIHASFCWNTWAFLWGQFKRDYSRKNYLRAFMPSRNRAWVYRWFETFVNIRYFYNKPKQCKS